MNRYPPTEQHQPPPPLSPPWPFPPIVRPGLPRRRRDHTAAARRRRAVVAFVLVVLGVGCEARPPAPASSSFGASTVAPASPAAPSAAGLLVAAGGPIQVTNANGRLVRFASPSEPVERLSAAGGTVVAVTAGGVLLQSRLGAADAPGEWREIRATIGPAGQIRLPAVGPSGTELAVATGDLQARSFELVIVDVATDAARTFRVDRGLDGSPSWLGPRRIAIDAAMPNGAATLVMIDPASGALSVPAITGTAISATPDGGRLAIDDPLTGDVLVGAPDATGGAWAPGEPTRIAGSGGAGVEGLALSADGERLAVVQRIGDQAATIVLLATGERGWAAIGSLDIHGDHAVSIAWLH